MDRLVDEFQTERLSLRRWRASDCAALSRAITASRDHLRPWMPWIESEPLTESDRLAWIEQTTKDWADGGDVILGIFLDGEVVGGSGLHRRRGPDTLEIGYWIHVDHVRRGIASESTVALSTAAFAISGIHAVEIHHDQANLASRGIPAVLGYTLIGETPDSVTSPGEIGVDCCWRVRRTEWMRTRSP